MEALLALIEVGAVEGKQTGRGYEGGRLQNWLAV
jgi:hypothetical protein